MEEFRHAHAANRPAPKWIAIALLMLGLYAIAARAADPAAEAGRLSDQSFTFLNAITGSGGANNPLIGPVAGFAGDAQTLASALKHGDNQGAAGAMASLQADRTAVDSALRAHPDPAQAAGWAALKNQLNTLASYVKPGSAPAAGSPPPPASALGSDAGSVAGAAPTGLAEPAGAPPSGAPRVVINSRSRRGGELRVKGFFEGNDISSAGIYDGAQRLEAIHVDRITGLQRVNFDLKLSGVRPGMTLRIITGNGDTSEAPLESGSRMASSGVEVTRGDRMTSAPESGGPEGGESGSGNTAEIPSYSSRSRPHNRLGGGTLTGVRINVISVNQSIPGQYEVTGQISGPGVRRAGIYVNGRLVSPISITNGAGINNFDTTFQMMGGGATIRAYGLGGNFVETAVNLGTSNMPMYSGPMVVNPYAYGANPYVSPYGANPYGYGANPYAGSPYGSPYGYRPNPYGYGAAPYGSPYGNGYGNPAMNAPWWQRLMP